MRDEHESVLLQVGVGGLRHLHSCGHQRGDAAAAPMHPPVYKQWFWRRWCGPAFGMSAAFPALGLSHSCWLHYLLSDNSSALPWALPSAFCASPEKQVPVWLSSEGKCGKHPHSPLFPITLAKACWNWTTSTTFWLGPSNSGNCQERTLGLCRASLVLHEASSSSGQSWTKALHI